MQPFAKSRGVVDIGAVTAALKGEGYQCWLALANVAIVTRKKPGVNRVTIAEVADVAGVSRATVSRAFSRPDLLNPATVVRIRGVAEKLGYVVNHAARALSTGRLTNIAIVVPDIANPFFAPLVRRVQAGADQAGFAVFLGDSDEVADREEDLIRRLSPQVEGFVLVASRLDEKRIKALNELRPIVLVNRDIEGLSRVLIDPTGGIDEAMMHVHRLGHRTVAYLAGPAESWSDQRRRIALDVAATKLDMVVKIIEVGRPSSSAGRDSVGAILASGASVVIAFDDVEAQGVLAGLAVRGIDVPRAISVIGCDDTLASGTNPALTTISSAAAPAGEAASGLLVGMLGQEAPDEQRVVISTHLVVRGTTDDKSAEND